MFFKGALLEKNTSLLINAQDEKTQSMRQIRFEKGDKIETELLRLYIDEAIKKAREGKRVTSNTPQVMIASQLESVFKEDFSILKDVFKKLTPGRQREYADYISTTKREETKLSRFEKIIPMIKAGKGLNNKYR